MPSRFFITGGAGFIGSHFVSRLLGDQETRKVTIYDNFSSGREWRYESHKDDPRLFVIRADVKDLGRLRQAMAGHGVAIHLASNPDIARAAWEPEIDFVEGTLLTHNVLEAMRQSDCKRILYASGSGVYGDLGELAIKEDHGPLVPISTYGASKLAGEAMISAYCHMFGLSGLVFRFANVAGPRQSHGVGFDFLRSLSANPSRLAIQGDGRQSKSYIHVDDVVEAVMLASRKSKDPFQVFNVATGDYMTVKEIALLAIECLNLDPQGVVLDFKGGARGWKGDVPVVRLDASRIRDLGWKCKEGSRQALKRSMLSLIGSIRAGDIQ